MCEKLSFPGEIARWLFDAWDFLTFFESIQSVLYYFWNILEMIQTTKTDGMIVWLIVFYKKKNPTIKTSEYFCFAKVKQNNKQKNHQTSTSESQSFSSFTTTTSALIKQMICQLGNWFSFPFVRSWPFLLL